MNDYQGMWRALEGEWCPGLTIHVYAPESDKSYVTADVRFGGLTLAVRYDSTVAEIRAALMLAVDAVIAHYESLGVVVQFKTVDEKGLALQMFIAGVGSFFSDSKDHDDDKALTLGALLKQVREAIGG